MVRLEPGHSKRSLTGQLLWFLLWVGVTAVGLYLSPDPDGHGTHTQLGLAPCPSVVMFGKPCPGCGLTTSFTATIHGHFTQAFAAHPMGPILYGLFTISALYVFYGWIKGLKFNGSSKAYNFALMTVILIFLGFGTARFFLAKDYARPGETLVGKFAADAEREAAAKRAPK